MSGVDIFGLLSWLFFLGILIWFVAGLYMSYSARDQIVQSMPGSPRISALAPIWWGTPLSRLMWISLVSSYAAFPEFHRKRGQVDVRELANLPVVLRRKLVILTWLLVGSVLGTLLTVAAEWLWFAF